MGSHPILPLPSLCPIPFIIAHKIGLTQNSYYAVPLPALSSQSPPLSPQFALPLPVDMITAEVMVISD